MIFYHYTNRAALESILEKGLNRGEAPLGPNRVVKAINLTTDPDPSGHGLDMGGHVVTEAEAANSATSGHLVPAGTVFANKREVRIEIKLPAADPKLKQWRTWSRKHCEPGFAAALERAADPTGRKPRSWWLYFGTVSPQTFKTVKILVDQATD